MSFPDVFTFMFITSMGTHVLSLLRQLKLSKFLILTSYWFFFIYFVRTIVCISITNISSSQARDVVKTTETPKTEPVKKTGLVPSVAPEEPRVMKPKHELSSSLKAEPSKKQEPALFPTKRHETSPVLLEVQKADVYKITELTPASRELVEIHLAKETVIKEGTQHVLMEVPIVEPDLTQSPPELPRAKPEHIQETKQAPLSYQKSPPKRGIISTTSFS